MEKSLYVRIKNEKDYKSMVTSAMLGDWMFSFPNGIIPDYNAIKKHYHGNSKPLLHLFYNDITGGYEMSVTTAAIEKTYPTINNVSPVNWEDVTFSMVEDIFGSKSENENKESAERLAKAIKRLANNPESLGNFENYLAAHFDKWLATWVTTPAGMASEFEMFAEM